MDGCGEHGAQRLGCLNQERVPGFDDPLRFPLEPPIQRRRCRQPTFRKASRRENAGERVDEGGCPSGARPALALDGVPDGARKRGALEFGLHQNVLSAFAQQAIREVFIRFVGQHQDGSAPARRIGSSTSRKESSSAGLSGRLRLSRTASNESRGASSPARRRAGPQARCWRSASCTTGDSLRSRAALRERSCSSSRIVLHQQELQGFWVRHSG